MAVYFDEPEPGRHAGVIRQSDPEDDLQIFSDDEPLDPILYGKHCQGPTRAGIFQDARESVDRIKRFYIEGKMPDMLQEAFDLGNSDFPLSERLSLELAAILKEIVPDYPNPANHVDLSLLVPMADRVWNFALSSGDPDLQDKAGSPIYRCYEHNRQFDSARRVLEKLLEIARRETNGLSEAVLINNYAFEYLLEERWQDAVSIFEEAANQFKESGDSFEWANARANYWICRLEIDRQACIGACEKELPKIEKFFAERCDWRLRKMLVIRARIEEYRGRLNSAVKLLQKAVKAARDTNTCYPEIDGAYMQRLIENMATFVD